MSEICGDDHGFQSELVTFIPRLRAFARTLTGRHAAGEDLAQETVMRAWKARATFEPGTNMEAWLFRILRNAHVSGIRRNARTPQGELGLVEHTLAGVDDPSATVALNDLRQALNRLSDEQREALVLIGAGGWSYEEAAAHAGCAVGTMKSRVHRARRLLAAYVDGGLVRRDTLPASQALQSLIGQSDPPRRVAAGAEVR